MTNSHLKELRTPTSGPHQRGKFCSFRKCHKDLTDYALPEESQNLGASPLLWRRLVTLQRTVVLSHPIPTALPQAGLLLVEEIDLEKEEAMPWSQI